MEFRSFCLIFNSIAWNYSKFTSALCLGFDFFQTSLFLTLKFQIRFLSVFSSKFAVTLSSIFFNTQSLRLSQIFSPPSKTSLVGLCMFLKILGCTVLQNFKRIWVWAFFHSLSWHPHGPVQFWNLRFCFSLGTFSSVGLFFLIFFFFSISLFSFSYFCFIFLFCWTSQISFVSWLLFHIFILFLRLFFM